MPLPLHVFAELDSTQDHLNRHLEWGSCGVMADTQSAGRGRGDNRWESAPGAGLWLSARLPASSLPPGILLQRAMSAVAEALEPWSQNLGLKWPNDLVAWIDGRLCKLGGIIGEMKGNAVVLGLGVNLTSAPRIPGRAIPPACLADLGGGVPSDREALARDILHRWTDLGGAASPAFLWPGAGEPVAWEEGSGTCLGWEPDGRLRIQTATTVLRLASGDLHGLKPEA